MLWFIWFIFWILTIAVGSKKGEGCISIFTGLFLGPIGFIIAVASNGNRVKCPLCKEYIKKDALICPHCKSHLKIN